MNYFEENVCGTWNAIYGTDIIRRVYKGFENLSWQDCYFNLNFSHRPFMPLDIGTFDRIILSSHFQTIDEKTLFSLFDRFDDKKFLLIVDQNSTVFTLPDISAMFHNVKVLSWITWHYQIDFAISQHGLNTDQKPDQRLLSCLSGRQDMHKCIVTAFILSRFSPDDIMLSWQNLPSAMPYWFDQNFYLPENLKSLLHDPCLLQTRRLDQSSDVRVDGPDLCWNHPPFVDCLFNVCLESQFNDVTEWRDQQFRIPGPMFTEKTWKPMLAGQCFLPVGQAGSCASLSDHGISFDFLGDLSFDSMAEFDRLNAIMTVLDQLKYHDRNDLRTLCHSVGRHNLEMIRSGHFRRSCNQHNERILEDVYQWLNHA
jgi:hypothetical protein